MYAIVDIAGQQFKIEKGQKLFVHRQEGAEGSKMSIDKVLLIDNDGKIEVGQPLIEGAQASATILDHLKDDKVLVFHKKRRKGFKKLNGHRQYLSQIVIDDIVESGAKKVRAVKQEEPKVEVASEKPLVAREQEVTIGAGEGLENNASTATLSGVADIQDNNEEKTEI